MMKTFNITGTCFPEKHYMVDISDKLKQIVSMIDEGKYFWLSTVIHVFLCTFQKHMRKRSGWNRYCYPFAFRLRINL